MRMTALSASRIKTNKNCEMKYFIEYHIGLRSGGNIYTHKGSAVHEALELWTNAVLGNTEKANIDYKQVLLDYYAESKLWEMDTRAVDKGGDPYPQEKNCENCEYATKDSKCQIAAVPYAVVDGCPKGNFDADLALTEGAIFDEEFPVLSTDKNGQFVKKVIAAEKPFYLEVDGVPIRGVIDLVLELNEDTIEIVDYKTGRSMSYNAAYKDAQVRIYGKIISLLYPKYKHVMVTLWFLKKYPVTVAMTPEMNSLTVKSIVKNDKLIRENVNPGRPKSWLCNWCVGHDVCGAIKDSFKVDGKFVLPTITCRHKSDEKEPCWGTMKIENQEEFTPEKANEITHACTGHFKIHKGGEYRAERRLETYQ